jgi:hypothetical protein
MAQPKHLSLLGRDCPRTTGMDVCLHGEHRYKFAQFVSDITALSLGFQDKGHDIVLMMDANEASGPGSGVDKIMREFGRCSFSLLR